MKKINYGLMSVFLLSVCLTSPAFSYQLTITSSPAGAEVYVRSTTDSELKRLGDTPFDINVADIASKYVAGSNVFIIEVKKKEHVPYRMLMSDLIKADIKMNVILEPDKKDEVFKVTDKVITELFEAQRLVRGRQYQQATDKLNDLSKQYPYLSVIPELQGSNYYLQEKFESALDSYSKAFQINPENHDAYTMKIFIEKSLGVKKIPGTRKE